MPELIVALDFASQTGALAMVDRLGEAADFYKVGLELYTRSGPDNLFTRDRKSVV